MRTYTLHHGDCLDVLKEIPSESVQLIVTSPPYADARKNTYGGIHPDKYVEWFLPRVKEFKRVLKPKGTFVLNIKEKVVAGERHTYVMELVLALKKQGWLWTEEWIWHKKSCTPGKWPNRFRDAWEHLHQFNLEEGSDWYADAWDHVYQFNSEREFDMHQDEVRVPIGDWSKYRLTHLSEKDKSRVESSTGSGSTKHVSNWLGRDMVYPSNVLHLAAETGNKNHSAAFPKSLPEFFVKLFSQKGELVLDPFSGSGTTGVAALSLGRQYLGIDMIKKYLDESDKELSELGVIRIDDIEL